MTSDQYVPFDLRRAVRVLRTHALMITVIVLVAGVGMYTYSSLHEKIYAAASEVQVGNLDEALIFQSGTVKTDDRDVSNQLVLINSANVSTAVLEELGPENADKLRDLDIDQVEETDVVRITQMATDPKLARDAVNTRAILYIDRREEQITTALREAAVEMRDAAATLEPKIGEWEEVIDETGLPEDEIRQATAERNVLVQQQNEFIKRAADLEASASLPTGRAEVVQKATLPNVPVEPKPIRDATVVAIVALVLAVGLAFLIEWLNGRVTTAQQAEKVAGVPVLGSIPVYQGRRRRLHRSLPPERHLVKRLSPAAEAYGALQMSLRYSSLGKEKRTVAITSSGGGEGKTTVTANLGAALAESGMRVVIISADLRRPTIGPMFGVDESSKGLTSVLVGDASLADCLIPITLESGRSLYLLPSGPVPHNPAELLGSEAFGTLLERIESAGVDFILIDCPPLLPVSDPMTIAHHVDGFIMLALAGGTKERSLAAAIERLRQIEASVIGVVLNAVTEGQGYYGDYGYHRYHRYQSGDGAGRADRPPTDAKSGKTANGNGTNGHKDKDKNKDKDSGKASAPSDVDIR